MTQRAFRIGGYRPLDGAGDTIEIELAARDLTQHAVVVGMSGSGKTGMLMVLVEEALRSGVPVLMFDVKGDLPNLALTFPESRPDDFEPWLDEAPPADAAALAAQRREGLASWGIDASEVQDYRARTKVRVITPGTRAGELLNVLSSLETPSPLWTSDVEAARESLGASISLLLRLVARDPDPTASRDHVVLSVFAEKRLRDGRSANVEALLADLEDPPIENIGAMSLDAFLPKRDRRALATALNTLLASPTFASWREGIALDVAHWLRPGDDGRTPAVIVSVAHLDDEERALVMGLLLEEVLTWVRSLAGTSALRALVVFDEVYGYAPPHPSNPPAKRPLVSLMKHARAFGVGWCSRRRTRWIWTTARSATPGRGSSGGCRPTRIARASSRVWWGATAARTSQRASWRRP